MNLPSLTRGQRKELIEAIDLDALVTCDGDRQRLLTAEDRVRFPRSSLS